MGFRSWFTNSRLGSRSIFGQIPRAAVVQSQSTSQRPGRRVRLGVRVEDRAAGDVLKECAHDLPRGLLVLAFTRSHSGLVRVLGERLERREHLHELAYLHLGQPLVDEAVPGVVQARPSIVLALLEVLWPAAYRVSQ